MNKQLIYRFAYVALALGGFVATSLVFRALVPPSNPEGVAEKLSFFAEHKDEFDTIFLGSSRFHYALSPERFDTITRENGVPTRTFNFGVDGMSPPETFYVLEQILKTQPRHLKWVFLEFDNIQTKLHADILGTQRLLYWHDWPRTALTLRKAVDPSGQGKWYQKLNRLWSARRNLLSHLALFQKQFANAGRGVELFSHPSEADALKLGPKGDGYRLSGAPMSPESAANFRRKLAAEASAARPEFIDSYAEGAYRDYAAEMRELGAGLIFVVPPSIFQSPMLFRATPPPGPLFAFNDCKTYPQLCDTKVRVDEQHLTDEGAAEFTRLLALEFAGFARRP
ncbi:MAG TPA: hypothetical protein VGW39_09960 [Chthoniobacterales bacterium]|nr:hypothetical protein [Chthoniobacterales bacterium]